MPRTLRSFSAARLTRWPSRCLWVALLLARPAGALGFHDQGVGSCPSCHVMHESEDGLVVASSGELLRAESASDVCLNCHADDNGAVFGIAPGFPPPERGAGNFAFLLEDNLNDAPDGATLTIHGEAAGHSIVAPSMGVDVETRWPVSPGGSYPGAELGCTSCHDPHGNQNYRMLWGTGPVQGGSFSFVYPAPQGAGIALSGPGESITRHTAYLRGWSNWCANCHGRYHSAGSSEFRHPWTPALGAPRATNYGLYAGDANPAGGTPSVSYLPEVPYEDLSLQTNSTGAPSPSSRVSCMSCHRAHATSAPGATRWDTNVEFLTQDGVVSGSFAIPNPYPSAQQGSLCAKCHGTAAISGN